MIDLNKLKETLDRLNCLYGKGTIEAVYTNQDKQFPATRGHVVRRMQYGVDRRSFDIYSKGIRGNQVKFLGHTKIFK